MDEITLINLLNKICEKDNTLSWQLNCKYNNARESSIMEVGLFDPQDKKQAGQITFKMETGKVISGKFKGMVPFSNSVNLIDALLEILYYEQSRVSNSLN